MEEGGERTLGEQIEARWARFLGFLRTEARDESVRAQIASLQGIGSAAVIVLFRRHINSEIGLIKAKNESLFDKLPAEHGWVRRLFEGCPPLLRARLWLYVEMFAELTA